MHGILTAIFITTAFFAMRRSRFEILLACAVLVAAPVAFGLVDGVDGLTFALVGAFAALFLTIPLSILGYVSRQDVIVSAALGGTLGAVQFGVAFCIATAFLSVQRLCRIDASSSAAGLPSCDCGAPAGDRRAPAGELSALVEIETLRMRRMDREDSQAPAGVEGSAAGHPRSEGAGARGVLPWCAELAIATLAVLMIGNSF